MTQDPRKLVLEDKLRRSTEELRSAKRSLRAAGQVKGSNPAKTDAGGWGHLQLAQESRLFASKVGRLTAEVENLRSQISQIESAINYHSTFISYGSPDEEFAWRLRDRLVDEGVETFFFPVDAPPAQKLDEVMRKGVNEFDFVLLVCSENSLTRSGVANEIAETLSREAREGGKTILVPIRLDDYVLSDWAPERPDIAIALRDRVIADFSDADLGSSKFEEAFRRLLNALARIELRAD